jgi:Cof subfamily protein (haloacid dehalogenase superfamily)
VAEIGIMGRAMPSIDEQGSSSPPAIRLVLSDVDGTLVTPQKELTGASIDAVRRLGEAGILFALTSGRPPRGMAMYVEPLRLSTPIAAFNGGMLVETGIRAGGACLPASAETGMLASGACLPASADHEMKVIEQHAIPGELVAETIALLESFALSVWVYRGADWLVRDPRGPHVEHETFTVQFAPTPVDSYDGLVDGVAKIVGVSDDHDAVARAAAAAAERFGDSVSASRSQPYYVDVTHPLANKGSVVRWLAARYGISSEAIATIGDMPNDVLMFAHSGLSIAMGNADREVQRAARRIADANDREGFAGAIERFVLAGR